MLAYADVFWRMLTYQARTMIWLFWVLVLTLNEIFKIPDPTRPITNLIGKLLMCDSSVGAEVS
jgi:hypothetical protein